jgi:hypothetical protein
VRQGFEYAEYAILALVVVAIVYAIARRRRRGPTGGDTDTPALPDAS